MKEFPAITGRSAVTFERLLPGPIEKVWSYLTDPKYLALWFDDGTIAQGIGGEVRFEMGIEGRVTVFDPPRVLEYTWTEEDAPEGRIADALVRWELTAEGDNVRLRLTHSRLPENGLASHGAGWHMFLQRLSALLERRELPPLRETYDRLKVQYDRFVIATGPDHVP